MPYRHLDSFLNNPAMAQLLRFSSDQWYNSRNNGDLPRWRQAHASLPDLVPGAIDLQTCVRIGSANDCSDAERDQLEAALRQLMPWRKGPYELFGVHIDTEWRSDWKWERLLPHLSPLAGRSILDVGSGNGYHCFRMAGAGARLAIGVDPQLAYAMQFQCIKRYVPEAPVYVLPATLDQVSHEIRAFDTVFSMGVLYHRRSPIDHLLQLQGCLRPGGELVLETLVVEGPEGYALTPRKRYGRMPNVWYIPSCDTTLRWLERCGFRNCRLVDVSDTTVAEQRSTDWMRFESLVDCLDPENPSLTVEGYPGPKRAIFIAENHR